MPKIVISDTSCLIVLTNIGELELLHKIYGNVFTTVEIAKEYREPLPDWIKIQEVKDKRYQKILEIEIGKGEASAILLAIEIGDATVIIDDYRARKVAERLGLDITGTIGVIVKAKLNGTISTIKPLLKKLKETDFRLSKDLEIIALNEANEKAD